jgi:tRNA-2-methylthio-N6-dimethylallyladenosine synthase
VCVCPCSQELNLSGNEIEKIEGLERLRFTSPHPIGFKADLVESFGRLPKLMPHVHLPMQSASDRILKKMHRGYTAEKFFALTEALRKARKDIAVTTDIIVGFPGETDEDYAATREMVKRVEFDNAFIFRYSPRRDTPAATMEEQLPESVKEERNQDLLGVLNAIVIRKHEELVGTNVEVLCEGLSKNNDQRLSGRTPQNKIVIFEGNRRHYGQLLDVRVTRSSGFTLYGDAAIL